MKKAIIKTAAFLLILAALFAAFAGVYSFKFGDGIYGLKTFFALLLRKIVLRFWYILHNRIASCLALPLLLCP